MGFLLHIFYEIEWLFKVRYLFQIFCYVPSDMKVFSHHICSDMHHGWSVCHKSINSSLPLFRPVVQVPVN